MALTNNQIPLDQTRNIAPTDANQTPVNGTRFLINYNQMLTEVENRLVGLETNNTTQDNAITQNNTDIATNATNIATNASAITTLQSQSGGGASSYGYPEAGAIVTVPPLFNEAFFDPTVGDDINGDGQNTVFATLERTIDFWNQNDGNDNIQSILGLKFATFFGTLNDPVFDLSKLVAFVHAVSFLPRPRSIIRSGFTLRSDGGIINITKGFDEVNNDGTSDTVPQTFRNQRVPIRVWNASINISNNSGWLFWNNDIIFENCTFNVSSYSGSNPPVGAIRAVNSNLDFINCVWNTASSGNSSQSFVYAHGGHVGLYACTQTGTSTPPWLIADDAHVVVARDGVTNTQILSLNCQGCTIFIEYHSSSTATTWGLNETVNLIKSMPVGAVDWWA